MMFAFINLYEYAGRTMYAENVCRMAVAAFIGIICLMTASAVLAWIKGKRKTAVNILFAPTAVYFILWLSIAGRLDHDWFYLESNVKRSFDTYKSLVIKSAFVPPRGNQGKGAFLHLATQDSGFSRGKAVETRRANGHEMAVFQDEDYGKEVLTLDGRPLVLGNRFKSLRFSIPLFPIVECPYAKRALVVGAEARAYADVIRDMGLKTSTSVGGGIPETGGFDLVMIALAPEWTEDSGVDAAYFEETRKLLNRGGICAYHLDARLLPVCRVKGIMEEFGKVFSHFRVWCAGRFDWVLTGFNSAEGSSLLADDLVELFAGKKQFEIFLAAGYQNPAEVFASYVGNMQEVMPALAGVEAATAYAAREIAPRLAFADRPGGIFAQLRPGDLLSKEPSSMDWFLQGGIEEELYLMLLERIATVQRARRLVVNGMDAAESGNAEKALEYWARAGGINRRDPMLDTLADSLDLEGRRRLRVGDVNGAMRCYENLIVVAPEKVSAIHNFGICLKQSGRMELAMQVFAKAIAKDPANDEHRFAFIECASAAGRTDLAVEQIDLLIKRNPENRELKIRRAKLLVGRFVKEADRKINEKAEKEKK